MEIRQGYKQTEVGIIPEEWEVKKLGEISEEISYGMNSSAVEYDGENKYIRITDINEENRRFIPNPLTSPDKLIDNKYLVKEGDILFARTGASVGKSYLYKEDDGKLYFAGFLIRFNIKKENNAKFIFYQTLTERYRNWVEKMSMRSGQPGINAEEYKTFLVVIPPLKEQEKITEILSYYDKAIEQQELLIEKEKEFKKGMTQKIFSQEIRFKDDNGEDYPEWEEKKLRNILKVQGGYAFKSEKFREYGIPLIRISNISNTNNGIETNNLVYYEEDPEFKNFIINNGDFLIALSGATTGKTSVYNLKQKAYLNQRVGVFRKIKDFYYSFIVHYGSSYFFFEQLDKLIVAGAQPNISPKDIENFSINLPILEEQEKIADFLSNIDNKIELLEKKLELLKKEKKGMMQKLLTGEVRVQI